MGFLKKKYLPECALYIHFEKTDLMHGLYYVNTRGATVTECTTAMSFCCKGLLIISMIKKVKMQEEVQKD